MDIESKPISVDVNISGGNSYNISNTPGITNPPDKRNPNVYVGIISPTSVPRVIGDIYINTVTKKIYFATGISSSSDWTIVN